MLLFIAGALVALVVCTTLVLLAVLPSGPTRWYLLGLLHAAVVALCLHVVHTSFTADEPETIWRVQGASGEESTRDVLHQAKRRRLIWGWVDSVTAQDGHIDHLVLTRAGGLIVLDSTWRSQADRTNVTAINQSAARAHSRARAIAQVVSTRAGGPDRSAPSAPVVVRPAVVMWGAAQHTVPEGTEIQGVPFVAGIRLIEWLKKQDGDPVPKSVAEEVLGVLEDLRAQAWQDGSEEPGRRADT